MAESSNNDILHLLLKAARQRPEPTVDKILARPRIPTVLVDNDSWTSGETTRDALRKQERMLLDLDMTMKVELAFFSAQCMRLELPLRFQAAQLGSGPQRSQHASIDATIVVE